MKEDFKNNKLELKILKDLYESINGLYAFTFYSKYKIEPEEIFSIISKYSEQKILTYENEKIELTLQGKNIILKQLFTKNIKNGKFLNIPSDFVIEKIEINSPYLPNINKVSAEILKIEGGKETSIKEV